MEDSYAHVLVPVDFSQASVKAAQRAVREASLHSAHLTFLHVVEFYPEDVPEGIVPPENVDPMAVYVTRGEERLRDLSIEIRAPDAKRVVLPSTTAAYHDIVRFAKDSQVDLIVIGYAGRWVTDALGSTAMAVARHVVCDVLLVRK